MKMRIGGNAMAIFLRRAFSSNNILLPRSSFQCRHLSQIICSPNISNHCIPTAAAYGFLKESRRGFAEGKKSKDNDAGNIVEVIADIGPTVKATAVSQMDVAIVALLEQLSKLRTGRASSGMLDHIIVETDGVKTPKSDGCYVSHGFKNPIYKSFYPNNGIDTMIEKSRKQLKERKNRAKKICGVKKTKASDAAKAGKKK